jgi:FAD/FMN-containing dehydrogenase
MDQHLLDELKKVFKGDILTDQTSLLPYSHDTSLFEIMPQAVVFPKDVEDVEALIRFVEDNKKKYPHLSLTGRSGGTDMSGGAINDSIIVVFQKYFNKTPTIRGKIATTQPGVYYRDFEKETLKQHLIFPSYPASREICAMGGIVNNNSGGEKSLQYGKTERFVKKIKMVLRDGNEYEFKQLDKTELAGKMKLKTLEGDVYRKMHGLITDHYEDIMTAKPHVTKNSAGYYLWNVYDKEKETFDLTKLIVGAQGTLGLVTEASIELVPVKKHAEMMIIFLHDLNHLAEIINTTLPLKPDTFETYDDNTLKLALKFFPSFAKMLGAKGMVQTGLQFLPEFKMVLMGGLPKLILQIDFQSDSRSELDAKIAELTEKLKPLHPKTRIAHNEKEEVKYWLIRRESFNLLRQKIHNLHTAPFIDDFVVDPTHLAEFIPRLNKIMGKYPSLIYTVAGHVGNGNLHIIPLMDLSKKKEQNIIPRLSKEVYDLILEYHGSTTGEHNDGLIRTPYLKQMYGEKIVRLFEQTKFIFDPDNIFNPRKKVHPDLEFAMSHVRHNW